MDLAHLPALPALAKIGAPALRGADLGGAGTGPAVHLAHCAALPSQADVHAEAGRGADLGGPGAGSAVGRAHDAAPAGGAGIPAAVLFAGAGRQAEHNNQCERLDKATVHADRHRHDGSGRCDVAR